MMSLFSKDTIKDFLGEIPHVAELYWQLRQPGKPLTAEFALDRLDSLIPTWAAQAGVALEQVRASQPMGKRVFIFATLRYWIEHAVLLAITLGGMGHQVTFSFLPYARWQKPISRFNLRRQNIYAYTILRKAEPVIRIQPLLNVRKSTTLPSELDASVQQVALRDTQYTLQVEDVDPESELYRLRLSRNTEAARAALAHLQNQRPDVVILPNGTILEYGALYHVIRHLGIPVVTYEFGEQQQRIWIAQNAEVMRQETNTLWAAHSATPLTASQLEQVRQLFAARQRASLWENFARRWQGVASQGGEEVRSLLDLDQRPIALLATNVIGDSLTLGRQVFSDSMTEWLKRTISFFAQRPDIQLLIRIHPGELITKGPSVADVVHGVLPRLPEHIHLISADAKINTYDLVEIADLGLVYTTTVGLEMAMSGVPVIVVGNTHYRSKGFTLDPNTWDEYFKSLVRVLDQPAAFLPTQQQVEQAWNYAYRFFFEYPHPFPWHLLHIWNDLEKWPIERVLSAEGNLQFGNTFRKLVGEESTEQSHSDRALNYQQSG